MIEAPELGTINLHAGRLPEYRGGSPLNWQIINGEREAGISVVRMGHDIDSGEVLAEERIPISEAVTIADLHERAHALFPDLVLDVVGRFERGKLDGRSQATGNIGYWHQRNDDDGRIDWRHLMARQVFDLVRAVTRPYPGAFADLDGQRLRIYSVEIPERIIHGVPGRIVWVLGQGPYVVCRDRAVLLKDFALADGTRPRLATGMRLK